MSILVGIFEQLRLSKSDGYSKAETREFLLSDALPFGAVPLEELSNFATKVAAKSVYFLCKYS